MTEQEANELKDELKTAQTAVQVMHLSARTKISILGRELVVLRHRS